ncbi:MAG: hypothetical protein U9O78_02790, partial [Patescibacteria group bacterium]|nr:hypothetical protein [Patescibacteria group bacterium]
PSFRRSAEQLFEDNRKGQRKTLREVIEGLRNRPENEQRRGLLEGARNLWTSVRTQIENRVVQPIREKRAERQAQREEMSEQDLENRLVSLHQKLIETPRNNNPARNKIKEEMAGVEEQLKQKRAEAPQKLGTIKKELKDLDEEFLKVKTEFDETPTNNNPKRNELRAKMDELEKQKNELEERQEELTLSLRRKLVAAIAVALLAELIATGVIGVDQTLDNISAATGGMQNLLEALFNSTSASQPETIADVVEITKRNLGGADGVMRNALDAIARQTEGVVEQIVDQVGGSQDAGGNGADALRVLREGGQGLVEGASPIIKAAKSMSTEVVVPQGGSLWNSVHQMAAETLGGEGWVVREGVTQADVITDLIKDGVNLGEGYSAQTVDLTEHISPDRLRQIFDVFGAKNPGEAQALGIIFR